jgi:4'-phosphopantetheinyl transferase
MARGMLRVILSRYLNVTPGQIQFHYNRYGKPRIMDPAGTEWLNFNVSHSGDLILIAIAHGRKIGVDLEQTRQDVSYDQVAQRFFSPQEYAMLQSFTAAEAKRKAFFDYWTRKEAYIKAQGQGLSIPLEQFDVSLDTDEPARLLANRIDPEDVSRWTLQGISPGQGYTGAIAVEGNDWRLTCFDYSAS